MRVILNGFEKTEARGHFFFFGQVPTNFIKSEKPALQLTVACMSSGTCTMLEFDHKNFLCHYLYTLL